MRHPLLVLLVPLHSASTSCNNSSSTAGSIHLAAARAGADLLVVPARCSLSPGLGSKRGAKASDSTHHSAGAGEAADRVGSTGTVENGWSTLSTRQHPPFPNCHIGLQKRTNQRNHQPVRLLVNDRKFPAGNNVFLSHQTSQQ